jgi:hypothetical protein
MSGGHLNRLVEARALDDVEAGHLFFGFGERAIGYQQLAVADADGGGIAAWPEPTGQRRGAGDLPDVLGELGTGRHGRASEAREPAPQSGSGA